MKPIILKEHIGFADYSYHYRHDNVALEFQVYNTMYNSSRCSLDILCSIRTICVKKYNKNYFIFPSNFYYDDHFYILSSYGLAATSFFQENNINYVIFPKTYNYFVNITTILKEFPQVKYIIFENKIEDTSFRNSFSEPLILLPNNKNLTFIFQNAEINAVNNKFILKS